MQQGACQSLPAGAFLVPAHLHYPISTNVTNIHQSCNAWMTPESYLRWPTRSARLCPRRSVSKWPGKSVNLGPSRFAKRWLRLTVSTSTTIKMLTAHWLTSSSRPWLSMIVWYYLVMFPDPVPMGRSQDGNLSWCFNQTGGEATLSGGEEAEVSEGLFQFQNFSL